MASAIVGAVLPLLPEILQTVREFQAMQGRLPTADELGAKIHQKSDKFVAEIDAWNARHPDNPAPTAVPTPAVAPAQPQVTAETMRAPAATKASATATAKTKQKAKAKRKRVR